MNLNKIILVSLLLNFLNTSCIFGQYRNLQLMSNDNQIYSNYIFDFKAIEIENEIYINWKSKNNLPPGYLVIYKSNNYSNFQLVSIKKNITIPNIENITVIDSYKDNVEFPFNTYHIVYLKENEMMFFNDNILFNSLIASSKVENYKIKNVYMVNKVNNNKN